MKVDGYNINIKKSMWYEGHYYPLEMSIGYPCYSAHIEKDGKKFAYSLIYNEDSHSDELEERFKNEAIEAFNRKKMVNE